MSFCVFPIKRLRFAQGCRARGLAPRRGLCPTKCGFLLQDRFQSYSQHMCFLHSKKEKDIRKKWAGAALSRMFPGYRHVTLLLPSHWPELACMATFSWGARGWTGGSSRKCHIYSGSPVPN